MGKNLRGTARKSIAPKSVRVRFYTTKKRKVGQMKLFVGLARMLVGIVRGLRTLLLLKVGKPKKQS